MDALCTSCKQMKDCRPAGINGEIVCLTCANRNPMVLRMYMLRQIGFTEQDEKYWHVQMGFNAYAAPDISDALGQAALLLLGRIIQKAHEMGVFIKQVSAVENGTQDVLAISAIADRSNLATALGEKSTGTTKLDLSQYDA